MFCLDLLLLPVLLGATKKSIVAPLVDMPSEANSKARSWSHKRLSSFGGTCAPDPACRTAPTPKSRRRALDRVKAEALTASIGFTNCFLRIYCQTPLIAPTT